MSSIVIIGAGECGVRAAFELRGKGFEGAVTLLSGEASLPYERPPLSKDRSARTQGDPKRGGLQGRRDIDLRLGTSVDAINLSEKTVLLNNGETVGYDKLLDRDRCPATGLSREWKLV